MPARSVIINADDLGLCPSVSRGIFAAWTLGAVGDSSVFANAPDLPELLQQAAQLGLPVGVHLNLTFGRPLSDPADIPALVSPAGVFLRHTQWCFPLPVEQIRRELTGQLRRVTELGWHPSHLDSHHHVQRYAEVQAVLIELAHAYRLPARAIDPADRTALSAAGIATPDHFSMTFYGGQATVETLIQLVAATPDGLLEVMTHPGYLSPELPGSYREAREQELAALTAARWRNYLAEHEIPIQGFAALGDGGSS